jgi:16S rRNA (cytidine1402-2'-O)-methyltransferase
LAPGLYVIATPIGNLSDMSPRALDILARADLVAVEDTRVTGKLLSLMGLSCTMVSYTEHNDDRRTPELLGQLAAGKVIALVSDAGTPLISDPGQRLVAAAAAQGRRIVPVPGPSAVIAALSVAGLSTERFMFAGFLPARAKARRESLSELGAIKTTLIFYEAPHRLIECLQDMAEMLGPRPAIVARELTKLYEEIRRGSLVELFEAARHQPDPKGEIVIVIGPPVAASADVADGFDLDRALAEAMAKYSLKDAVAAVADAHGLNRRAVYARAIALKEPLKNS